MTYGQQRARAQMFFLGPDGTPVLFGECTAYVMTKSDGSKIRYGAPEAVFDLEQTEEDLQLLSEMKISI